MSTLHPIRTVREMMAHLGSCNPDADLILMPEQEDGFLCGGVLQFNSKTPPEVWILIDEYTELSDIEDEGVPLVEWQGAGDDDDLDEGVERPGDMACSLQKTTVIEDKADVVRVRGKMRSA